VERGKWKVESGKRKEEGGKRKVYGGKRPQPALPSPVGEGSGVRLYKCFFG